MSTEGQKASCKALDFGRGRSSRAASPDPIYQPDGLEDALEGHTSPAPSQPPTARPEEDLQGQTETGAADHGKITQAKLPDVDGKESPDLDTHGIAGILDVSQHACDNHDGQADPEESEEAMKVPVLALGIKVGDTSGVIDGGKQAVSLLSPNLLPSDGYRLNRWRGIHRKGGGAAAGSACQ